MNFSDRNKSDYLFEAVKITSQRDCDELDREHAEDICECGDYRRDHPNNGACNLNGLGHGIPSSEPEAKCLRFRLSTPAPIGGAREDE
jgi:hypothetical protein